MNVFPWQGFAKQQIISFLAYMYITVILSLKRRSANFIFIF